MKHLMKILLILLILIAYPDSSNPRSLFKYYQVSMGTIIEITLIGKDPQEVKKAALQAFQEIRRIESLMSEKIASSDVARINRSAGKEWIAVSPETLEVIRKAQEISVLSHGGFDISIGPVTQLWRVAMARGIPPSTEDVKRSLDLVNFRDVRINREGEVFLKKQGMAIDLGGIAKGYAVDRAFEVLRTLGYKNLIVNAGGDLRQGGSKFDQPWSIGIQHPRIPRKIMATFSMSDAAIATSGDYERFFVHQGKRYHHIFDPRDGSLAEGCQSVTVIGKEDLMTADALTTAIFILGPEKGYALCEKIEDLDCIIVDRGGKITFSPRLRDRISFDPYFGSIKPSTVLSHGFSGDTSEPDARDRHGYRGRTTSIWPF